VFGRKKRRQEPIPAVAPEPLVEDGRRLSEGVGGGVSRAGASGDGNSHATDVSRETRDTERGGAGVTTPGSVAAPAWGLGAVIPTAHGETPADRASAASGREPTTGALSEINSGSGFSIPATDGSQAPAGVFSGGMADVRLAGVEAAVRDVSEDGYPTVEAEVDAEPDGTSASDTDASVDATEVSLGVAEIEADRGVDVSPTPSASFGGMFPDGADGGHGAFSSAPRLPASRPTASTSASGVSRETAVAAMTRAPVVDGDLDGAAEKLGSTSAHAERTGENGEVRRQQEQVFRVANDDEARRAALVDSLPAADEDTPLMAQIQADARRRIQLRGRRFPRPEQTRIITVANQKGGVGKTTTTVNLAAALAQSGLNVLVLDNDPQGNASTALGVEHHAGTPSIYEVLVDEAPMAGAVQECPDVPNLWCVPATIDLSGAEIELVSMVARETRLRTALDAYLKGRIDAGQEPIDYVFVDCPPSLGLLTVNAFVVGREVLIPIQCEYYALEGLTQLLKTIQLIQAHLNPELHVSTILLTMYDSRTNLAQQVAQEVRDHFPETTLRTSVPRSVRISEAPSYGQTVITYDAGSTGALAYLEAARELAERGAASRLVGADAAASPMSSSALASGMHDTNENGTPGGTSSVVGSSAGTHLEEQ
jgi:chromosome partitioning protein